uniref:Uncharacterized protein n=1 Tax=Vitis vinifera TaxID=29760 RepID=A5BAA7_VITVI|nr:hypothetical protein VITISV_022430 [Vitis vinifera]
MEEKVEEESCRNEDSKANARVVEIFASHHEAWRREEKRMVDQIHSAAKEIAYLRAKLVELERSKVKLKAMVEELTKEVGGEGGDAW